ncbi:Sec-independent protein translocase protein TatB [Flavisphingomonas formosensis]|uniref:Sec-independent protein translocase protein TatB n=1 Tax=Flavisphingomonas formosensis TaxID=861534 RepID=UPI001E47B735|nr:Sec-independent protein translocase protein TatB [Sphingomonas formosensis]
MFDVAPSEFLLLAVVALVVIGPKDLPRVMRVVGQWVGRARGMARHFRSGLDEMIRQSELEEMEKRWAAENERIMREYPQQPHVETPPDGGTAPVAPAPVPLPPPVEAGASLHEAPAADASPEVPAAPGAPPPSGAGDTPPADKPAS